MAARLERAGAEAEFSALQCIFNVDRYDFIHTFQNAVVNEYLRAAHITLFAGLENQPHPAGKRSFGALELSLIHI